VSIGANFLLFFFTYYLYKNCIVVVVHTFLTANRNGGLKRGTKNTPDFNR